MRTMHQWLDEYGASHRNPTNELLHWICVPPIVMTVLGFLWAIPVPQAFAQVSPWLNWATIAVARMDCLLLPAVCLARHRRGDLPGRVAVRRELARHPAWPLWLTCLVVFVVAWIGQFIGHAIEGTRPSFFKDVQFLLIGPIWLVSHVYRRLGVSF